MHREPDRRDRHAGRADPRLTPCTSWVGGLGDLADASTIRRGQDYADRGLVVDLSDDGDRITALVRGTEDHRVELVAAKRSWFCTGPVGVTGAFCKHCVAVAIHAAGGSGGPGPEPVELDTFDVGSGDDLT